MSRLIGLVRLIIGTTLMGVFVALWSVLLIALAPWRVGRIKACNYFGKTVGRALMFLSGCPLSIAGRQELDPARPAIYVSNHTSILDLFLGMWIAPVGTVGVAKKQVVYYPLFGQLYLLSGHLRIDRSNPVKAVASLVHLAEMVRKYRLSIWMWPEGTRSRDGRLLPFKKGIVHLALQTGLPIVPVVVRGAHLAWEKNTLAVNRVPIDIQVLPPVDTSSWSLSHIEEHLTELHSVFLQALPPEQRPVEAAA
jgi:1-acyl-sn-glycerol-3-phosphate acyltransferase